MTRQAPGAASGTSTPERATGRAPSAVSFATELRLAIARVNRRVRAEKGAADLAGNQIGVLGALDCEGPMTPNQLARHENITAPSMSRILAGLEELGFVHRSPHATDGRQVLIEVTDAGRAEMRETRRRRDAWLARRLAELSPPDRAVMARATQILADMARSEQPHK